jgi:hypothetical protein
VAVHNRKLRLSAGYIFDPQVFPWITLWEENRARAYPPWNGETRVRGVEFGTSPFPLGLEHAQAMQALFDTPVLARLQAGESACTNYSMFIAPVPPEWQRIGDVRRRDHYLWLESDKGEQLRL